MGLGDQGKAVYPGIGIILGKAIGFHLTTLRRFMHCLSLSTEENTATRQITLRRFHRTLITTAMIELVLKLKFKKL